MVLLIIACVTIVVVLIYIALIYYFLFVKEKSKEPRPGIFNINASEMYFPEKKKKRFAMTGFFVAPLRRHRHEKHHEHRQPEESGAFPRERSEGIANANMDFTDIIETPDRPASLDRPDSLMPSSPHPITPKEERTVHFEDHRHSAECDDTSNTYHRSEDVDQGYDGNSWDQRTSGYDEVCDNGSYV